MSRLSTLRLILSIQLKRFGEDLPKKNMFHSFQMLQQGVILILCYFHPSLKQYGRNSPKHPAYPTHPVLSSIRVVEKVIQTIRYPALSNFRLLSGTTSRDVSSPAAASSRCRVPFLRMLRSFSS